MSMGGGAQEADGATDDRRMQCITLTISLRVASTQGTSVPSHCQPVEPN